MGRKYICNFAPVAPGIGPVTMLEVFSSATHSFKCNWVRLSSIDTAGATVPEVRIYLLTVTGTGTALTPAKTMSDDTAFTGTAKSNDTVEPTKSTILDRAVWNLITPLEFSGKAPDGTGDRYVFKAGGAEGLGVTIVTNPGTSVTVEAEIEEL